MEAIHSEAEPGRAGIVAAATWCGSFLPRKGRLAVVVLVGALLPAAVIVAIAAILRQCLDGTAGFRGQLLRACAVAALLALNAAIAHGTSRHIGDSVRAMMAGVLRDLLQRLHELPHASFVRLDLGRVHSIVVQDAQRVETFARTSLGQIVPGLVVMVAAMVFLGWVCGPIAALLLVPALIILLVGRGLNARIARVSNESLEAWRAFTRNTLVALKTLPLTRARGGEADVVDTRAAEADRVYDLRARTASLQSLQRVIHDALLSVTVLAALFLGAVLMSASATSLQDLVVFSAILTLLRSQVGSVLGSYPTAIEGMQSLRVVHALATMRREEPVAGLRAIRFTGAITLRDVTFSHLEDRPPLLAGIDLELRPGRIVSIVGPNGAGKTTLGNVILGFFPPRSGAVLADGVAYAEIDMAQLRRSFGVVPQEQILIPGTIRENVLLGRSDVSEDAFTEACRLALVEEFVLELEMGFDTPIGDDGRLLSGGQRQRLAVARALAGRPKLLLLDEPTNHLDKDTVVRLLENLKRIEASVLVFSHDEVVIAGADRVLALAGGRLSEVIRQPSDEVAAA